MYDCEQYKRIGMGGLAKDIEQKFELTKTQQYN